MKPGDVAPKEPRVGDLILAQFEHLAGLRLYGRVLKANIPDTKNPVLGYYVDFGWAGHHAVKTEEILAVVEKQEPL